MNIKFSWWLLALASGLAGVLLAGSPSAVAAEVNLVRTNWAERVVTNLIEVRMPLNRFVNEYHTNWFERIVTNRLTACATNETVLTQTNVIVLARTNWLTVNLTNWQNVVLIKTNWLVQPVTNVVAVDLPAPAAVPQPPATDPAPAAPAPTSAIKVSDSLAIQAARTARPPRLNLAEVRLTVHWLKDEAVKLQVRQWRIESREGAILCFGQDPEFKRELPLGAYNVEVRTQPDDGSPVTVGRGILTVTAREATVQPRPVAKR